MKNLGIIFGGMSTEHDVSIVSATSIIETLDKKIYNIFPIYINKEGEWFKYTENIDEIEIAEIGYIPNKLEKIKEPLNYLKQMDVVFPVLHGLYGEDGTIQGLLELINVPYVGCKVMSSAISMDKAYTKIIFDKAGLKQVPYQFIKKIKDGYKYITNKFDEEELSLEPICLKISEKIKFPMFVKPSNSGSSVGINKANNIEELKEAIIYASKFDEKILIEQGINALEIECAVLETKDGVKSSNVGEILSADDFYSYDAKYKNMQSKVIIPANISDEISNRIRQYAIKAFNCVDGKGLARVDFFVEKGTEDIYINEINTMPGFTNISMYPKLWEATGISYAQLLDMLIENASKN